MENVQNRCDDKRGNEMNRRDVLKVGAGLVLGYMLGIHGCPTGCSTKKTPKPAKIVPLTHEDFNRLFKAGALDDILRYEETYTWKNNPPHDITAFPSGNYSEAGYDLDILQKILLRPFEDPRQKVNATSSSEEEELSSKGEKVFSYRYSLMPGAAVALRMMSDSIGKLKTVHSSLPEITLIDAINQNYTEEHPRNAYRSFHLQLLANGNSPGATARAGISTHGTGNSVDFPMYLVEDSGIMHIIRMKAKEFGFLHSLAHPGALGGNRPDLPHFEYVGSDMRNCPTADAHFSRFPITYSESYRNAPLGKNLPPARNFPRPQDLVEYAQHDQRIILEASLRG